MFDFFPWLYTFSQGHSFSHAYKLFVVIVFTRERTEHFFGFCDLIEFLSLNGNS